jgi:hypothetical protein
LQAESECANLLDVEATASADKTSRPATSKYGDSVPAMDPQPKPKPAKAKTARAKDRKVNH